MDHNIIVGLILFFLELAIVAFLGGLLYLIYLPFKRHLTRSGRLTSKASKLINIGYSSALLVFLIVLLSITYIGVFPRDEFYIEEFKKNTGLNLPESANIIRKDASYPDQFGDFWAGAVIELEKSDYDKIKADICKLQNFQVDTTNQKLGVTESYQSLTKDINEVDLETVFYNINEQWFKIGFHKDGRTIIFERSSS